VLKFTYSKNNQISMSSPENQTHHKNGSSSSGLFVLFFIFLIGIGAFATNPSSAQHKLILKDKMRELLNTEMEKLKPENESEFSQLGITFGAALGGMIVDKFIDQSVRVDDYYLFSITNVYYEGKKNPVGMGVFGKVILHPDFDKMVKNSLSKN